VDVEGGGAVLLLMDEDALALPAAPGGVGLEPPHGRPQHRNVRVPHAHRPAGPRLQRWDLDASLRR